MCRKTPSANAQLTAKQVNKQYIPVSPTTIRRLARDKESSFPPCRIIGRSLYWSESSILDYLSKKAGVPVKQGDRAILAKDLLEQFDKSHTWLWQNVKSGNLPKPFKISNLRFWLKSQIDYLLNAEEVA